MRGIWLGRYRIQRFRVQNFLTLLSLAMFLSSFSLIYFIYTSPGRANAYLYQFHIFQNHLYHAVQHSRVNFLRQMSNESELDTGAPSLAFEPIQYLPPGFHYSKNETCPEKFPEMRGLWQINMTEISLKDVYANYSRIIKQGGVWVPHDCLPKYNVAILVPFRNRFEHLPILLRHLFPLMLRQRLQFTVFVVEQRGDYPFNRAMLLNVGFVEAEKFDKFDCFIFHDVDHIPENDRNYYGCTGMPRHFAEQLDIHLYKLEYPQFFGGVSGVTSQQFRRVNGFTNQYWGWGGEDDDFYTRITHGGYNVSRPPYHYGRYSSIKRHHVQEAMFLGRFSLLKHSVERNFIDGLNSLQYPTPIISRYPLYTNISVELTPVKDLTPVDTSATV